MHTYIHTCQTPTPAKTDLSNIMGQRKSSMSQSVAFQKHDLFVFLHRRYQVACRSEMIRNTSIVRNKECFQTQSFIHISVLSQRLKRRRFSFKRNREVIHTVYWSGQQLGPHKRQKHIAWAWREAAFPSNNQNSRSQGEGILQVPLPNAYATPAPRRKLWKTREGGK